MKSESSTPHVSAVIGAYNAAPWIGKTISSVLAQTYPGVEVIVVDDGSTDETAEVVAGFGEAVRYIWKENGGSASARNRGIRAARGAYVAFLDADDLWAPEKLKVQMQLFEEDPELAWSYTDALLFESETGQPLHALSQVYTLPEGDVLRPLLLGNFVTCSTVVVRGTVFDEVGYFDEAPQRRISEDWDMWLRIAARHRVRCIRQPMTLHRQHLRRKTETMDLDRAMQSRLSLIAAAVERDPEPLADLYDSAAAHVYIGIGRKWLNREVRIEARRLFWRALALQPLALEPWIFWTATLIPRPVLHLLGSLRRAARGLRGGSMPSSKELD